MFDLIFYVFCWVVMLSLALPLIFAGILSVAVSKQSDEAPQQQGNDLVALLALVTANKENKEALTQNYETFKYKFNKCDGKDKDTWIEIIHEFCVNPLLMETNEVANFRDKLEDDNPEIKEEIRKKIGEALQQREKK
ncbi:hypothetical protein ACWIWK_01305 [Helicobacter sp. 23-1048]